MEIKERNIGIDVLKFIAIILITNTHMKALYGPYGVLGTGGAMGNALFFFCSGFTLFLKPFQRLWDFPNWYKRRINRIYPTVLATAIVFCTIWGIKHDINYIILFGGRWFVTVIMVYYVFLYFVGLYFRDKINWVLLFTSIVFVTWYFLIDTPFPFSLYADDRLKYKWILYFIFMLFGAKMGMTALGQETRHQWRNLLFALFGIIVFYVLIDVSTRYQQLAFLHVLSFVPLIVMLRYLYLWANGNFMRSVYRNKFGNFLIRFVGGLCLEIYLIQNPLMTTKLNHLFPLNILIVFTKIVIAAYLLRCLARFISQTFKDAPYDWKKMVSPY